MAQIYKKNFFIENKKLFRMKINNIENNVLCEYFKKFPKGIQKDTK